MKKKLGLFIGFVSSIYAGTQTADADLESYWIWVAVFALGVIGIVILFLSSKQMSKIQKMHKEVFNKQLEMEKNQAILLTSMSENIHSMATEALKKSTEAIEKVNETLPQSVEDKENEKNTLLDVTNDLIGFLRLKSRKVEIVNEAFNLNNVLNEVSGTVSSQFKGSNVSLIFDIDNTVPRMLVGDSLHLGQILNNLLENRLRVLDAGELKLEISMFNTFEESVELQLQLIDNGAGMTHEEVESLFTPYYDEGRGQYVGLGLFVAQELVTMMNGELSIHSNTGKGTSLTLTLPFKMIDVENKRKYRLPEKILTDKKVFIVDSNFNASLALKKMFSYFKHDVKVSSIEKFTDSMPKLEAYDIVIMHESLFTPRAITYLEEIKEKKDLKVISLSSLLAQESTEEPHKIIDRTMYTPLNQERIFEMIINMYALKVSPAIQQTLKPTPKAKIYTSAIRESLNIDQDSFSVFAGKNLLIVEDNMINQKVLTNILSRSGMNILLANNGLHALKLIERKGQDALDLVLMDINMPVMDGYIATQKIRYNKEFDSLPIVSFTALVLDSEIEKMFNSGINAFLAKPLNIGKLYKALSLFLLDDETVSNEENRVSKRSKEKIPALYFEKGIRHSGNSEALYMEVLKEFSEAYGSSDTLFEKLVQEQRYEQLKMLCLDMKGLSGTIGAQEMNAEISEVQKHLLYKQYEQLDQHIALYKEELQRLIEGIKLYLNED